MGDGRPQARNQGRGSFPPEAIDTISAPAYLRGIIATEQIMTTHEKNATLRPEILQQLAAEAEAQGKSVDDVLDEAARKYLDVKHTIGGFREFVSKNRKDMDARGVKESDIAAEIAADRKERRR